MTSWIHMVSLRSHSSALWSSSPELPALSLLQHSTLQSHRTGPGHFEIFLNLTFKNTGRFTSISKTLLKLYIPNRKVGALGMGVVISPKDFANWPTSPFACLNYLFFFPSPKDCYLSFPRLLLGILGWHRVEQDTDFCRDPAGISVWE